MIKRTKKFFQLNRDKLRKCTERRIKWTEFCESRGSSQFKVMAKESRGNQKKIDDILFSEKWVKCGHIQKKDPADFCPPSYVILRTFKKGLNIVFFFQ